MSQQHSPQPSPIPPMPAPSGLTPRPRAILPVYVAEMLERISSLEVRIDETSKRIGSLEDGLTDIVRNFASCQEAGKVPVNYAGYTPRQFATLVGRSIWWVYRRIEEGKLSRMGSGLIPRNQLDEYLRASSGVRITSRRRQQPKLAERGKGDSA
jgi:hypothetical protein